MAEKAVVKLDEDKLHNLIKLAFQTAEEAIRWTEAYQAEIENGTDPALLALLRREESLAAISTSYKSQRDVYYGLGGEEGEQHL